MDDDRVVRSPGKAGTAESLVEDEGFAIVEAIGKQLGPQESRLGSTPQLIAAPVITDMEGEPYVYEGLDERCREIRLMTILPGRFHESIACRLNKTELSDAPGFEALSYSWGDPGDKGKVQIDGKCLDVTSNLAIALRYLRFEKIPRVMWIDAICVNQSDLAERSEQVLHMAEIYSSARDVIVWLGESTELIDELFTLMNVVIGVGDRALAVAREYEGLSLAKRRYQRLQEGLWYFQESTLSSVGRLGLALGGSSIGESFLWKLDRVAYQHQWARLARKIRASTSDAMPQHGYPTPMDLDEEVKQSLKELFSRSWWSRMWVIQEFLLAEACTLICGKHRVAWEDFHRFVSWEYPQEEIRTLQLGKTVASLGLDLHQLRKIMGSSWRADPKSPASRTTRNEPSARRSLPMSELMLQFESYQASDPRDKIYALLNLAGDGECVVPDYNASLETVYTKLVQALVTKTRSLDIICKHHRGYRQLDIPSWVPDWSVKRELPLQWSKTRGTNIQSVDEVQELGKVYNACQSLPTELKFSLPGRMLARGIKHDVVWHTIELNIGGASDWHQICFKRLLETRKYMELNARTIFNEDIVLAFWRTLLHDVWWNNSKRITPPDCSTLVAQLSEHNSKLSDSMPYTGPSFDVREHAAKINKDYKLMVSRTGNVGLVPLTTKVGDHICVLMGAQIPLVLRCSGITSTRYEMVGPAYVHGLIMDGEAIQLARKKGLLRVSQEWFDIS